MPGYVSLGSCNFFRGLLVYFPSATDRKSKRAGLLFSFQLQDEWTLLITGRQRAFHVWSLHKKRDLGSERCQNNNRLWSELRRGDISVLRTSYVDTTTRHLFYLLVKGRLMLWGLKLAVAGNVEKSSLLPKFLSVCMIAAFQPTFDGSAMQQLWNCLDLTTLFRPFSKIIQ